jgi:hypothetical protein
VALGLGGVAEGHAAGSDPGAKAAFAMVEVVDGTMGRIVA